ncbi:MAG: DUF5807 family protein [Halobacteriaceae archaeon]
MSRTAREAFLAGDRPDDVALYFHEDYMDADALASTGERVGDGVVLVVPGEEGRALFERATGLDAMAYAREAGGTEGHVDRDLAGGTCPDAGDHPEDGSAGGHDLQFLLAFAQEETPDAGGRYAEGDVIHAYATCTCGTSFAERWVA